MWKASKLPAGTVIRSQATTQSSIPGDFADDQRELADLLVGLQIQMRIGEPVARLESRIGLGCPLRIRVLCARCDPDLALGRTWSSRNRAILDERALGYWVAPGMIARFLAHEVTTKDRRGQFRTTDRTELVSFMPGK